MRLIGIPMSEREPWRLRMSNEELDSLEQAILIASRSDDIGSPEAAFVARLQELITKVKG